MTISFTVDWWSVTMIGLGIFTGFLLAQWATLVELFRGVAIVAGFAIFIFLYVCARAWVHPVDMASQLLRLEPKTEVRCDQPTARMKTSGQRH
jgi:hypothetical protein